MDAPQRTGSIQSAEQFGSVRLGMRNYFSTNFLWTALHMSRLVGELEAAEGSRPRFDMAHRSLATASVIASATFLEATVNELFQDAHDGQGRAKDGYLASLTQSAIDEMAQLWRATDRGKHLDPLEKWDRLLGSCGHAPLNRGTAPAQDAGLLMRLRNALVHFKPDTTWADEQHQLERQLRGKFAENRLMQGAGNPWWPSHGLGYGCCEWAARSARVLADQVLAGVGITPYYERIEAAGWNGTLP